VTTKCGAGLRGASRHARFKAIHIDDETLGWIVTALKASQKDEIEFHKRAVEIVHGNSAKSAAA
jgi:hypothetical protein